MPIIGPDQLHADAVVPQCLDNQFVSDGVFETMTRRSRDFSDADVARERERVFRTEFIRSLVYSSQVVVQRAYFRNSDFLYKNYLPSDQSNFRSFAELMRSGAIVPFLLKENSLADDMSFDVDEAGENATRQLLAEVGDLTCAKFSVEDAENERACTAMCSAFGNGLTRLINLHPAQQNAMASELFADPSRLGEQGAFEAFSQSLRRLSRYAFEKIDGLGGGVFSRTHAYQDLFLVPGTDPTKGRFLKPSADRPYLLELKKYVDLVYNCNLPDRLRRYTFTAEGMPTRLALQDEPGQGFPHEQVRQVVADADALEALRRTFMAHAHQAMNLPILAELTMTDVLEVRDLPEWRPFQEAQVAILLDPLHCLARLEEFQQAFDRFQCALSDWYNRKYKRPTTEARYASFVAFAVSIAGRLVIASSNLGPVEQELVRELVDKKSGGIADVVKGYAAKLMVGVYDLGKRQLDADRSYSVELMRTHERLMREDVEQLLQSINYRREGAMPGAADHLADQGSNR